VSFLYGKMYKDDSLIGSEAKHITKSWCLMACDSQGIIARMIESDQRFIRSCWYIYSATKAASIALTIYLHLQALAYAPTLAGMLINGIAFPFIPKHLQRIGAVDLLKGLYQECCGHDIGDPACKRIADNVDYLVRARGGI
jgi:hypothetical protein